MLQTVSFNSNNNRYNIRQLRRNYAKKGTGHLLKTNGGIYYKTPLLKRIKYFFNSLFN